MREFWLGRNFGLSLFEAFSIVCVLLTYLAFFDAARHWWGPNRISAHIAISYLTCFVVLAAIGRDLYVMRTSILSNAWFEYISEHESLRNGSGDPALILDTSPTDCESVPTPCVFLELPTGKKTMAHVPESVGINPTEIAWVTMRVGSKTGDPYYYQVTDYIPGDARYRWSVIKQ